MHRVILSLLLLCLSAPSIYAAATKPPSPSDVSMVTVPGGCFAMGNTFGDSYHIEMPVHEVCISSFSIGKFDVTWGEFQRFVAETGYHTEAELGDGCYVYDGDSWKKDPAGNWRAPGFPQESDHPVTCVSWNDANAYAKWLSGKEKRHFRLPTEAQWEYAARSGGKRERYAGGNDIDAVAWYLDNAGHKTHPVGRKQPNGLGLYDMSGNVWQWTADWFDESYYRESPRLAPEGPLVGTKRIFRGGSWFYDSRGVRASYRDFAPPEFRSSYLGFRLAAPAPRQ